MVSCQYGLHAGDWSTVQENGVEQLLCSKAECGDSSGVEFILLHYIDNQALPAAAGIALNHAATGGHLELVEALHHGSWLQDGRRATGPGAAAGAAGAAGAAARAAGGLWGASRAAMDGAAAGGHLEVVEWLHRRRTEGCSRDALNRAARHAHFRVVKWLHQNRPEGDPKSAIMFCSRGGTNEHLRIMEWLRRHAGHKALACLTSTTRRRHAGTVGDPGSLTPPPPPMGGRADSRREASSLSPLSSTSLSASTAEGGARGCRAAFQLA